MQKKITTDQIVDTIVDEVLASNEQIVDCVAAFTDKVCKENFGVNDIHNLEDYVMYSPEALDLYFDVFDKLIEKSQDKNNSFVMRKVPSREEQWGMPYVFDYVFKNASRKI